MKMKRVFLLLSLALICLNLKGQTYEESMRYWKDGPLVWEDLPFKSPRDFRTCDLRFRWLNNTEKTRPAWNTVKHVSVPSVALDKSISWHNQDRMYPCALAYDQLLFDLNELYFRKMLTELYSKDNTRSGQALYDFYTNQSQARWAEIHDDTNDGLDSAMVAYHTKLVAEELERTSYPQLNKDKRRFLLGYNMGYGYNQFFGEAADVFGPTHGLTFDMAFGYRRHELGVLLTVGTGKMRQDFHYDGSLWPSGKAVNHGYVGFTYGFRVLDGTFFSLKPMVGVAGRTLVPTKENNREKEKTYDETVVLAGAEFHFKFHRTLSASEGLENCLGIRAFVARDFGLLRATSLEIGLFYSGDLLEFK